MASIKDLKKDINYVLGDIIDEVYVWQQENPKEDQAKAEAVIDEAIETFDTLIAKVNDKSAESRKKQLQDVKNELEEKADTLIKKVNEL
jgi:acyl-CoA reductase-like NAD-dependent aldehyde dehydrogenase